MFDVIKREFIYVGYYFLVQLRQIFLYWLIGMVLGSIISVFFKDKIHNLMRGMKSDGSSIIGIIFASMLGVASPLCMYGTIPIAASFSRGGIREHLRDAHGEPQRADLHGKVCHRRRQGGRARKGACPAWPLSRLRRQGAQDEQGLCL